jgi:hypothetical protein
MVITDALAIAIEAKWTEPHDKQTIAKRIARGESDGGDPNKTIKGWLDRIQLFAAHALRVDDFMDVIYQNIHRTASACTVAKDKGLRGPRSCTCTFTRRPRRAPPPPRRTRTICASCIGCWAFRPASASG